MASVNVAKIKTATEAKAYLRHDDKEERLKHEHSNKHIDKSLTPGNRAFWEHDSYAEAAARYDGYIRDADRSPHANKRSDRVTMLSIEFTVPEGIPDRFCHRFLKDATERVMRYYSSRGCRSLVQAYYHFDEQHEYINDEGQRVMSRPHAHIAMVPLVDDGEGGVKLCAKALTRRTDFRALNKSIDDMSRRRYGVPFMTGKWDGKSKSVEELKAASAAALEAGQKDLDEKKRAFAEDKRELDDRESVVKAREDAVGARERAVKEREEELDAEREKALKSQSEASEKMNRAIAFYNKTMDLAETIDPYIPVCDDEAAERVERDANHINDLIGSLGDTIDGLIADGLLREQEGVEDDDDLTL